MTKEEYEKNRYNLLYEMADELGLDLDDGEEIYDAQVIIERLEEKNKYSNDAIEEFVYQLNLNGRINGGYSYDSYAKTWEEKANEDEEALAKWKNSQKPKPSPPSDVIPKVESSFSIESVLGNTYPHVADILYEEYIPVVNAETFGSYTRDISTNCENITSLVDSIDSILSVTNSDVFYKGTEASKNVKNMKISSGDATTMKTNVSSETETNVLSIIKSYNASLKKAKQDVRIELLQKRIKEINGEVVAQASEKWTVHNTEKTGTISVTKIEGVYDVTLKREYLGESGGGWFSRKEYSYLETTIKTIAIPISHDYQTMEANILKVKKELPYDKSRIVE